MGGSTEEAPESGTGPGTPPTIVAPTAAGDLYAEREASATRLDVAYKGKRVRVTGRVDRVDNGMVYRCGELFVGGLPW